MTKHIKLINLQLAQVRLIMEDEDLSKEAHQELEKLYNYWENYIATNQQTDGTSTQIR